jgi:hypothetical protein
MAFAFRGLSQIIREEIKQTVPSEHIHPSITEEANLLGQNTRYFTDTRDKTITNVFRWGYSVWGIDQVIGVKYPTDLNQTES